MINTKRFGTELNPSGFPKDCCNKLLDNIIKHFDRAIYNIEHGKKMIQKETVIGYLKNKKIKLNKGRVNKQ